MLSFLRCHCYRSSLSPALFWMEFMGGKFRKGTQEKRNENTNWKASHLCAIKKEEKHSMLAAILQYLKNIIGRSKIKVTVFENDLTCLIFFLSWKNDTFWVIFKHCAEWNGTLQTYQTCFYHQVCTINWQSVCVKYNNVLGVFPQHTKFGIYACRKSFDNICHIHRIRIK